jgi:hypothetical protein
VDPPMRAAPLAVVALVLAAALATGVLLPGARAAATPGATTPASTTPPLTGNVTGPSLVPTDWNATFYLNASGGPADTGGVFNGTIAWSTSASASNLTGVTVLPTNGTITNASKLPIALTVSTGAIAESVTVTVEVTSSLNGTNSTSNLTRSFRIVPPYIVEATLVAGPEATVLPFNVSVALDGTVVGTVQVPELAPNATYALAYRYPTTGLSSGYHTFTLSIATAHGLVSFSNGLTVESISFYVAPATPNYTVWYIAGIVAFFGVLFIYATRVAARRQGSARR